MKMAIEQIYKGYKAKPSGLKKFREEWTEANELFWLNPQGTLQYMDEPWFE
jgi:hypothetical protein